jgi:hypothetical protein
MITEGKKKGLWDNIHAKRRRGERASRPGEKGYPETLDIGEGLTQARKNVGASKCWKNKKIGNPSTKMEGGKEVPNCVDEESSIDEIFLLLPHKRRRRPKPNADDRWVSSKKTKEQAKKLIDAQIARQDEERRRLRAMKEERDHEHSMARAEISKIISAAKRLKGKVKGEGNLPAWVQSKITRAADYIDTAADYADSGEMHNEGISFDIGPGHKNVQKIQKIYNKGKETTNPYEKETFLNKTGPKLPLVKRKNKTDLAHYDFKTFGQFMQEAIDKSSMKCNSPKAQAHGSGEQGKSHVVKACEGGEEKIIRFGQVGVKGSPKKEGESEADANRRNGFKERHAENIAKGKMFPAYWANEVKW